jgi:hypothetical protein
MSLPLILTTQEDNSLNNLGALRGVFGTRPGSGALQTSLARHSLSMRKSCLESYTLEIGNELVTYRRYHRKTPRGLDREVFAFLNLI